MTLLHEGSYIIEKKFLDHTGSSEVSHCGLHGYVLSGRWVQQHGGTDFTLRVNGEPFFKIGSL
jgi:hypothetical protein